MKDDTTLRIAVEEAYALALEGRAADALALLDDLDDGAGDAAAPEAADLVRARATLGAGGREARARASAILERLAARGGASAWRARLALARLARGEGRATDAAAHLHAALEAFRERAGSAEPALAPLSSLLSREVERLQEAPEGSAPEPAGDDDLDRASLVGLVDLGRKLAGDTEPERVLATLLHEAISLVGAERGFVVLVEAHGGIEFAVAENLDRSEVEQPAFEVSRTLIREVSRTGRIEFLSVAELPESHPASGSLGILGIRTVACVPMSGPKGVLGVLYLDARAPREGFGKPDRRLLELFASLAAAVLENARSHREKTRALETADATIRHHRSESERRARYGEMVGASDAMQQVYRRLDPIAEAREPVLVLGETGTGKELVARLIHSRGPRHDREFVTINCAGVAETLLESELFGHERGAFTGADRARPGLMEVAHGGTLFLDEVGDMSPRMQGDLLRVLESGEMRRIGGRERVHVDVRVIAATHRDLEEEVRRGSFRQDLYFRLNVLRLRLPPLRERAEDIPLLVEEFLRDDEGAPAPAVTSEAVARLMAYSWPGNVRELQNVVRRVRVLGVAEVAERHLPPEILRAGRHTSRPGTLREVEERAIRRAMKAAGGNKAEAARMLGVDRKTLYAKLKRLGG